MDPQATLEELLQAIDYGDADTFNECCENLAEWLGKGGFAPAMPTNGLGTNTHFAPFKVVPITTLATKHWRIRKVDFQSHDWQIERLDADGNCQTCCPLAPVQPAEMEWEEWHVCGDECNKCYRTPCRCDQV